MFPIRAHKNLSFFSLIQLYIVVAISFFLTSSKSVLFSDFVQFRFNLDCLFSKWRRKMKKQDQVKCFTEKKCLQTQKLRNQFYRVLKKQIKGFILIIRFIYR